MTILQHRPIRFRFSRHEAGRIFEPGRDPGDVLGNAGGPLVVPESSLSGLAFGRSSEERQGSPLNGTHYGIHDVYGKDVGKPDWPSYHPYGGRGRGLSFWTTRRLPNARQVIFSCWEGQREDDPSLLRTYFVPESDIVAVVEEWWDHPSSPGWKLETTYVVVRDAVLEPA